MEAEKELLRRIKGGDEEAFEELVKRFQGQVFNTIYRFRGGEPWEAEDLAQEVFLRVWRSIKGFKEKSSLSTWLYRIVINVCLNHRAKMKKRPYGTDDEEKVSAPSASRPDVQWEKKIKGEILSRAILTLPETQKMAFILSQVEGKSYREIAQIMGCSVSAVESLIFRARQNMRERLLPMKERGEL
jgi:RNA polymerase sigma-70 factor (ECF subfamily)